MNPFSYVKRIFKSDKPSGPVLLAITPPRTGERDTARRRESAAIHLTAGAVFAGDGRRRRRREAPGRCLDSQDVAGQIAAHYPQAASRG